MYVEDKVSHRGPFPVEVNPDHTLAQLKIQIEREFEIPAVFQRWILGKELVTDDKARLKEYGIVKEGCPVFLYLVAPEKTSENKQMSKDLRCVPSTSKEKNIVKIAESNVKTNQSSINNPEEKLNSNSKPTEGSSNITKVDQNQNIGLNVGNHTPKIVNVIPKTTEFVTKIPNVSLSVQKDLPEKTKLLKKETSPPKIETKLVQKPPIPVDILKVEIKSSQIPVTVLETVKIELKNNQEQTLSATVNSSQKPTTSSENSKTETNVFHKTNITASVSKEFKQTQQPITPPKTPPTPPDPSLEVIPIVKHVFPTIQNSYQPQIRQENIKAVIQPSSGLEQKPESSKLFTPTSSGSVVDSIRTKPSVHQTETSKLLTPSSGSTTKLVSSKPSTQPSSDLDVQKLSNQASASTSSVPPKAKEEDDFSDYESKTLKPIKEWECHLCTLLNPLTSNICAVCSTIRLRTKIEQIEEKRKEPENKKDEGKMKQIVVQKETKITKEEKPALTYMQLLNLDNTDLIENVELFTCLVCFLDIPPREGVTLRECLHQFCKPCLSQTIEFSDEAEVKCPYRDDNYACNISLQDREIKALVTATVYDQHLAKSVAQAENKIDNSFHCKTPDCKGWCVYEDNVNEFKCPVCRRTNCLTCQAIHTGMNCRQFQEKMKDDANLDEDGKKTKAMLEEMVEKGEAIECPTCRVILMKKWGCDWLRCSMCKTEICWVTRGPRWGPLGKGDTSGGCQCGVNGVKCHPKCNYCH